jgi:hypothetical protein
MDYKNKEKIIHELLNKYRVYSNKEFFKISLDTIKFIFDLIEGEICDFNNICEETIENNNKNIVIKYSIKKEEHTIEPQEELTKPNFEKKKNKKNQLILLILIK